MAATTSDAPATFIGARVDPALAERFTLAAQLDGRSVSSALGHIMGAYIETVADADTTTPGPLGEPRRHSDSRATHRSEGDESAPPG